MKESQLKVPQYAYTMRAYMKYLLLQIIAESHDSVEIKWDQPRYGKIINYTIYYNDNISHSWIKLIQAQW